MPSHVDLSVLWVPIMPETSKLGPAMEEAGKDATETFGKATSGIGDRIHDSFTKATGKVKDVFHKAGSDASESMAEGVKEKSSKVEDAIEDTGKKAHSKFRDAVGDIGKEMVGAISPDIKQQLSSRVEDVVGGAFKSAFGDEGIAGMVGGAVSKAAGQGFESWIDGVKDKVGGVKDTVNTTKQAFADLTGGKTTEGIAGLGNSFANLDKVAKNFGVDLGGLPQPIQDVINKTTDAKNTADEFAGIFKDLPGKIGLVGTAIEGLTPIIAGAMGGLEVVKQVIAEARHLADEHPHSLADAAKNMGIPNGPLPGSNLPSVLPFMNAPSTNQPAAPGDIPGMMLPSPPSGPAPSAPVGPWGSWFGGAGHPVGFPPRDVGSDKGLTPTSSNVKKTIATMFPEIGDIGGWRPPDGFNEHSSGQALDVMIPGAGTPQGKALGDQIRDYVMKNAKSLGVDYALWQQTQWNPDGSHSGMENRGSPTQNHMDHVHIHTVRGAGDGTMPTDGPSSALSSRGSGGGLGSSGGVGIPTGAQHDPVYTMAADSSGSGGGAGGSDSQSQGQQLGSGLVNGVLQEFGLDGSVFKGFGGSSNPLQFGITKLATGMANVFGGMFGGGQQGGGSLGGGGGGSILPGLGSLIPHSAAGFVAIGPGGAQNVRTGETQNSTNHYYGNTGPTLNVTQNGQSPTQDLQETANGASNRMGAMGNTPNSGTLPATGTG